MVKWKQIRLFVVSTFQTEGVTNPEWQGHRVKVLENSALCLPHWISAFHAGASNGACGIIPSVDPVWCFSPMGRAQNKSQSLSSCYPTMKVFLFPLPPYWNKKLPFFFINRTDIWKFGILLAATDHMRWNSNCTEVMEAFPLISNGEKVST